jgi:hypothetical protein
MGQREGSDPLFLPLSPTTTIHATGPIYLVDANLGQHLFRLHRRPIRRARLQALLLACLLLVGILGLFQPRLHDALASALLRARGGAPPPLLAQDLDFPVQSCCIGQQCVDNSKGRHAVVTLVRSQREVTQLQASRPGVVAVSGLVPALLPLFWIPLPALFVPLALKLVCSTGCVHMPSIGSRPVPAPLDSDSLPPHPQQLAASMRRYNPGVDLAVMVVRGQLGAAATQRLLELDLTVIYVEPLARQYGEHARCAALRGHPVRAAFLAFVWWSSRRLVLIFSPPPLPPFACSALRNGC